jgi:hypothetical protein
VESYWYYGEQIALYGGSEYDIINSNGFTGYRNFYYNEFDWSYDSVDFCTGSGDYAYIV